MGLLSTLFSKTQLKTKKVIDYNQIKTIIDDGTKRLNEVMVKTNGILFDKNGLTNLKKNGEIDKLNCAFLATFYASELVMLYNSPIPIDEYNDFVVKTYPAFNEEELKEMSSLYKDNKDEFVKRVDECLMYDDEVSTKLKENIFNLVKENELEKLNVLIIQNNINSLCQKMFAFQKTYKIEELSPVMIDYFLNTCFNQKAKEANRNIMLSDIKKLEQIYFEY